MKLIPALQLAQQYGLTSLKQLEIFIRVAESPGLAVMEHVGQPPSHKDYRAFMDSARKVMLGGYRQWDGLDLIRYGDPLPDYPKAFTLELTAKGKALWRKMRKAI